MASSNVDNDSCDLWRNRAHKKNKQIYEFTEFFCQNQEEVCKQRSIVAATWYTCFFSKFVKLQSDKCEYIKLVVVVEAVKVNMKFQVVVFCVCLAQVNSDKKACKRNHLFHNEILFPLLDLLRIALRHSWKERWRVATVSSWWRGKRSQQAICWRCEFYSWKDEKQFVCSRFTRRKLCKNEISLYVVHAQEVMPFICNVFLVRSAVEDNSFRKKWQNWCENRERQTYRPL